jgi:hypothetical protein
MEATAERFTAWVPVGVGTVALSGRGSANADRSRVRGDRGRTARSMPSHKGIERASSAHDERLERC